jgi:hypothetical protein
MQRGELNATDFRDFMLAGNATVTLESKLSGKWFTFKVQRKDGKNGWYVKLLSGPDNQSDYRYLGKLHDNGIFYRGRDVSEQAPSVRAFRWLLTASTSKVEEQAHIYHEGRCGRCGRKLTVPESVVTGFGPECIRFVRG